MADFYDLDAAFFCTMSPHSLQLCWICMLNIRMLYETKTQTVGGFANLCPTCTAFRIKVNAPIVSPTTFES